TVNVYGYNAAVRHLKRLRFRLSPDNRTEEFKYHYYDDATGETGTHSFELTMKVFEMLRSYSSRTRSQLNFV
ncbi:hypothetical protein CYMTET_31245, partial [Cymbomonas tetramitiformis]